MTKEIHPSTTISFVEFCQTRLASVFSMPWTPEQFAATLAVELAATPGNFIVAPPLERARGKTALAVAASLWAMALDPVIIACNHDAADRMKTRAQHLAEKNHLPPERGRYFSIRGRLRGIRPKPFFIIDDPFSFNDLKSSAVLDHLMDTLDRMPMYGLCGVFFASSPSICNELVRRGRWTRVESLKQGFEQEIRSKLFVEAEKTRQLVANLPKTGEETLTRHAIYRYENNPTFRSFVFAIRDVIRSSSGALTVADVRMAHLVLAREDYHGKIVHSEAHGFAKVISAIPDEHGELFLRIEMADGGTVVIAAKECRILESCQSLEDAAKLLADVKNWQKESAERVLGTLVICDATQGQPRKVEKVELGHGGAWYTLEGGIRVPASECFAYHIMDVGQIEIDSNKVQVSPEGTVYYAIQSPNGIVPPAGCSTCKGTPGGEHLYPCPHWRAS